MGTSINDSTKGINKDKGSSVVFKDGEGGEGATLDSNVASGDEWNAILSKSQTILCETWGYYSFQCSFLP